MRPDAVALAAGLLLSTGCALQTEGVGGAPDPPDSAMDGGAQDATVDGGARDAPMDGAVDDSAAPDASMDSGAADGGIADSGCPAPTAMSAFDFAKTITIDRSRIDSASCGATLADHPLLYSVRDPDLRDHVTDPQADDLVFVGTDATTCGGAALAPCTLDHEIERWNSTTGALVAWVRLPSLVTSLGSSDTQIEIHYGNPSITTSTQNPDGVWDRHHRMVLHAGETASPLADSSGNGNDATAAGTPSYRAGGQIGFGVDLEAGDRDRFVIPGLTLDPAANNWTLEAWVRFESVGGIQILFAQATGSGTNGRSIFALHSSNVLHSFLGGSGTLAGTAIGAGTFRHAAVQYDATANVIHFYLDGDSDSSDIPVTAESADGQWLIGCHRNETIQFLDGVVDELRVSDTLRSHCAIAANHANQADPGDTASPGFYAVGPQRSTAAVSCE